MLRFHLDRGSFARDAGVRYFIIEPLSNCAIWSGLGYRPCEIAEDEREYVYCLEGSYQEDVVRG